MANKLVSSPSGVQSGVTGGTGLAALTINRSARTPLGALGLATDVVNFAGGTGTWLLLSSNRVRVSGTPTVNETSFGQAVEGQQAGGMTVIVGDPRVAGV